jgi:hypothetical protein
MTTRGVRLICSTVVLLALSAVPALAAGPGVRIVRLSLAQGDVQIDRNISGSPSGSPDSSPGVGWEQAINNMPLTGGARVYAAEDSKAELEFEDGSSIRLAGPAQISLNQLSFAPDGSPVNQIEIDSGLVYVYARLNDHAGFRIQDSNGESFAITQPSHLRFKVEEHVASLSVLDGEVEVLNDGTNSTIRGGETYNYILGQPESAARLARVPQENEDAWDQQRDRYDNQYAAAGAQYSGSDNPDAYGVADLGYYGSYNDIPGYGESWQPTGVGPDWDPFDDGAWSYYPDWGWTFVSGYPWGWAPFYFGNWFYVGGRGWWWHPGPWHGPGGPHGRGGGWHPQPLLASTPHGFSAPHPPAGSAHRTVAIAGSNLRVGPIGVSHATQTHAAMPGSGNQVGATATRAAEHIGATSNLAHESPASNRANSLIGGQRGAYYVNRPSPGRNSYELHRPAAMSSNEAPRGTYSDSAPRAYSYGGSPASRTYAPRTYSVPSAPIQRAPAAPPPSSAPHVSGGGGGGGGFHGGSAGGAHGGGGRR